MLHEFLQPLISPRWLSTPMVMLASFIALIIIGAVIIFVVGLFIFFLPAIIVAGVVWWLTRSEFMAGVAFFLVSLLSLTRRKR